jgi:hypothetical protein
MYIITATRADETLAFTGRARVAPMGERHGALPVWDADVSRAVRFSTAWVASQALRQLRFMSEGGYGYRLATVPLDRA